MPTGSAAAVWSIVAGGLISCWNPNFGAFRTCDGFIEERHLRAGALSASLVELSFCRELLEAPAATALWQLPSGLQRSERGCPGEVPKR